MTRPEYNGPNLFRAAVALFVNRVGARIRAEKILSERAIDFLVENVLHAANYAHTDAKRFAPAAAESTKKTILIAARKSLEKITRIFAKSVYLFISARVFIYIYIDLTKGNNGRPLDSYTKRGPSNIDLYVRDQYRG